MSNSRWLKSKGRRVWKVVIVRAIMRVLLVLLLLLLLLSFSSLIALPAAADGPGDLDTTFGAGGKVTTSFGAGTDGGYSVAIQSDGRIVVVGWVYAEGTSDNFAVARYNANGSLDATFGDGGKVTTDFGGGDRGYSVAIQSDGRIVVAGYSNVGGNIDFALARYNANGTLDTSFGTGGKVTTASGGYSGCWCNYHYSVAIQGDGRIVLAGSTGDNFAVVRYNANGSLDTSFGTGGKVTTSFGGGDFGYSVVIQSDGRIVVAGVSRAGGGGTWWAFALGRYNANGSLDTTFGTGGKVITNFAGGDAIGYSAVIQSDGRIVAVGFSAAGGTQKFALARYNANGSLDTSFGTGGKVTTDLGWGFSAAIQSDGRIVVAGDANLARYNADGTLDTSFGTGGKATTGFDARSVAIQSDGKIVVAGLTGADFALARYLAAAPTPTPTPVPPTPTPTPVPGVGWPGLLALAMGLAALGLLAGTRRARAGRAS